MSKINFINSFLELKNLPNSSKVYKIWKGHVQIFIIVGTIKQVHGLIVANDASYKDLRFVYEKDFAKNTWTTDYDTKEVGRIMIEQIKDSTEREIQTIEETYLS